MGSYIHWPTKIQCLNSTLYERYFAKKSLLQKSIFINSFRVKNECLISLFFYKENNGIIRYNVPFFWTVELNPKCTHTHTRSGEINSFTEKRPLTLPSLSHLILDVWSDGLSKFDDLISCSWIKELRILGYIVRA